MNIRSLKPAFEFLPQQIEWTIERMALNISKDLKDADASEYVMVVVLKGGVFFAVDLARELSFNPIPMKMVFVTADSYKYEMQPAIAVNILYPPDFFEAIRGKYVLVVDDISGTGRTIDTLVRAIAHSTKIPVRTAAMLYHERAPTFPGIRVPEPNLFAVGYGMDWKGKYRNDPTIRLYTKEQLADAE